MSKSIFASLIAVALTAALATTHVIADDDDDDDDDHGFRVMRSKTHRGMAPVSNEQYRTECSSCHMAYPPGILPARSWQRLMSGLSDHFGDNAELDTETVAALEKYLVENAADRVKYRRSAKINRSIAPDATPLRVTETRYFIAKHDEIPAKRMVTNNPKVKSFSNCAACHRKAEKGNFSEHGVRIPGFERAHF